MCYKCHEVGHKANASKICKKTDHGKNNCFFRNKSKNVNQQNITKGDIVAFEQRAQELVISDKAF